jgi:quinol monooxygenase YgiN
MSSSSQAKVPVIPDQTLQILLDSWQSESQPEKKERVKQAILVLVEMQERSSFLTRFALKDFESWNKVLTSEEYDSAKAHKAEFYEPHLLKVLRQNNGKVEPLQAIRDTVSLVIDELTLADFALTSSLRFRYDTTIRFLADDLKKRGILDVNEESKNKFWMLAKPKEKTLIDA